MATPTKPVKPGTRYGHWTAIGRARLPNGGLGIEVICDCGTRAIRQRTPLLTGASKSCGCALMENQFTHGEKGTRVYRVWHHIIQRCENPNNEKWPIYGDRGITVCAEWHDYLTFAAWAKANGCVEGLEIDRIDNMGNYEPGNCRFVTRKINARNKRNNLHITAWGETKVLTEWLEDLRCVVVYECAYNRLKTGWTPEDAFSIPSGTKRRTHCKRGHEFTPENTVITTSGARSCRKCGNAHAAAYQRRKSGACPQCSIDCPAHPLD